jgi:uncharacterized delta-60 repeat protein
LNSDGSLDTAFNTGTGFSAGAIINTIALQPDGKIIVGGLFNYNGSGGLYNIVRLNTDGSFDPSFNSGKGFNNTVNTLALQPDGKIIAGGFFTAINSTNRNHIARLNGGANYIEETLFESNLLLYPNPNNGSFQLDYHLPANISASLRIIDVTGRTVADYLLDNNTKSININETSLNSGLYCCQILVNGAAVW